MKQNSEYENEQVILDHETDETGILSMREVHFIARGFDKLLLLFQISSPLSWL